MVEVKCPDCGKPATFIPQYQRYYCYGCERYLPPRPPPPPPQRPSRWWWLAPIFLGVIGGLVGYIAVRDLDRRMAKKLLIGGLAISGIWIILTVALPLILFWSGLYRVPFQPISLVDEQCLAGTVTFWIRNEGTENIGAGEVQIIELDANCDAPPTVPSISAGEIITYTITGCETNRTHTWWAIGPTNRIVMTTRCV